MRTRKWRFLPDLPAWSAAFVLARRSQGKLRHLSIGQMHNGKHVVLFVDGRDVRVHSVHGEFLRELRFDPDKIHQGHGA